MREYVMSANILSRYRNHSNRVLKCTNCDKPILKRNRAARTHKRYFHARCIKVAS